MALIAALLLKPLLLQLRHLQFYSPWQKSEDDMKRYLQIAFLIPFTLFGSLQRRRTGTRFVISLLTLALTGAFLAYATRNIDRDPGYPSRTVKDLYQNRHDANEKIILQTESNTPDKEENSSSILKVKPYSVQLQVVYSADTNRLDSGNWKRIY